MKERKKGKMIKKKYMQKKGGRKKVRRAKPQQIRI